MTRDKILKGKFIIITIRIRDDQKKKIDKTRKAESIGQDEIIRRALDLYFGNEKPKE